MIDAGRNDLAAILVKGRARHRALVSFESAHLFAGSRVPELEDAVTATGKEPSAVWTEHDARYRGLVASQRLHRSGARRLVAVEVPDLQRFVGAAGSDFVSLRIKRHRPEGAMPATKI